MLASGSKDGAVRLWCTQRKEMVICLRAHSDSVNSVAWNSADTHVASASHSVQLHSKVSGVAVASLKHKGTEAVKCIQFSPLRKHLLAAACSSGLVCVWDTNQRTLSSVYLGAHTSQASSVCFSPSNPVLLCSVGLDQRINFFDSALQRCVKTFETGAPLTALSFSNDGNSIAVGTLSGGVLLYDLRNEERPKAIFEGHRGHAVNWIEFSNPNRPKPKSKTEDPSPPVQKFKSIEEIREEAKARIEKKRQDTNVQETQHVQRPEESFRSAVSQPERRIELKPIRRVVQEAVMRQETGLREDISCLHVELVRQLTQQSVILYSD